MKVGILGEGLTSLTLAKNLTNLGISVDRPKLVKFLANARLVKPPPIIPTFIII